MDRRLALDTSGSRYAAVLLEDAQIAAGDTWAREAGGGNPPILTRIQQLLRSAGWNVDQLSAVAAARGPGSFTGIRVGLAIAAGIAYGRNIPLHTVDSLSVLAAQAPPERFPAAALRDAGRGEVFAWRSGETAIRVPAGRLAGWLRDGEYLVAEPAGSVGRWSAVHARQEIAAEERRSLNDALASQAIQAFMRQKSVRYDELEALYVQPAAAEERRN